MDVEVEQKDLLIPLEKYLEAGVHIGSKFRSGNMNKFIYKHREDGLCVLDISALNNRILTAAKFIARFEPDKVLVVAGRTYAKRPAKTLAEKIGAKYITTRFIPGTLTNPGNENFMEPHVILAADPPIDRQSIKEAVTAKVPVVALCDTSNLTKNIDLIIPSNNKGKKALALIFWLLTREILKEKGEIKSDKDFKEKIEDFEAKITKEAREEVKRSMPDRTRRRWRRRK